MSPSRWMLPALLALTVGLGGCVKKMAMNALADTLSGDTGGSFTVDEDIEFVGDAIPFALKLMESIHDGTPEHVGLELSLCSGFTQYGMLYVKWPAEQLKYADYEAYLAGNRRATKLLRRGNDYCMDALDTQYPGFSESIYAETEATLAQVEEEDVGLLYWTGASWMAIISQSREDMEAIGQLAVAGAVLRRALALDEDWDKGSIHDTLILVEPSLPEPGGMERAKEHYQRAVELAAGTRASPWLSYAFTVSLANQDREEFVELMDKVLALDAEASPADQLANLYAQEQARFYLLHLDDLFFE